MASLPPPARVEYVPPQPRAQGAVWIDGEWTLRRGRWSWKLGRWVVFPAGVRFSPWTVVRSGDGAIYVAPGVVRDADGQPVAEPPPLAVATADNAAIVDADGFSIITGRTLRASEGTGAPVGVGDGGPGADAGIH